jgi:autotransporter passenger strand-loop-strand repeat protein
MTTYTAPPTQTHLVLNSGDTLNVEVNGLAYDTMINQGAVLKVASGGTVIGTTNNGGNEYVFGTSTDMTLNFGGLVFVEAGAITGTTINAGGTEYDQGGASIGTTINLGGSQYVQNGSTATNTTIDGAFGIQYVDGGTSIATQSRPVFKLSVTAEWPQHVILDGGIEHVQNGSTANNVIFAGSNSLLDLDKPSGLTGTIIDWNVGEKMTS